MAWVHLEDLADQDVIVLVADAVFVGDLADHGDEDGELYPKLHDQSTERVHGSRTEFAGIVQRANEWVDYSGGKIGQV